MRIIPVLDVRRGQAVQAIAGDRDHYGPLRSVLHPGSDPLTLAKAGRASWGLPDLYLADLDAILGDAPPALSLFRSLAQFGLNLWVDAGLRAIRDIPGLVEAGVSNIIVGLETIPGPETLAAIVAELGPDRLVFSLDLHQGRPMVETQDAWKTDQAETIAEIAINLGVRRLIHLDLSRVGTGCGVASTHLSTSNLPGQPIEWVVGGGVASINEVRSLDPTRIQGVLIGSALHDGRINAEAIASVRVASR